MQTLIHRHDRLQFPLGERRKISNLGRFSLDLSWSKDAPNSAQSRAYPSPPMSGSPPLSSRLNLESSDPEHVSHVPSGGSSLYRELPILQQENMDQRGLSNRPFLPYSDSTAFLSPYRPDHMPQLNILQNSLQTLPQLPPQQHKQQYLQSNPEFSTSPQTIHSLRRPIHPSSARSLTHETSCFTSPKQQPKAKGHVASACVPCKKAHLRCDAQRPCSRCISNGKEDACVDVQHKKRGRPRLRDERESRYEGLANSYSASDLIRRPLPLHSPLDHVNSSYTSAILHRKEEPILHNSRSASSSEPACAYLSLEMVVLKVTKSFGETIGLQSILNRDFQDVLSANDREKLFRLQKSFEEERRGREPNYLPPIYLSKYEEDRVVQTIGFGPDDLGQVKTDRLEMFTFQAPDGQQRTFQVRLGLVKKLSIYFIVAILHIPASSQSYPLHTYARDSNSRESQYGYNSSLQTYPQNQRSISFPTGQSYNDLRLDMTSYRTLGPLGPRLSYSSPNMIKFAQPQVKSDHCQSQTSYLVPRSEIIQGTQPCQNDLQLPPIRDPRKQRDFGKGRLDIGGLLDDSNLGEPHG